MKVFSLLCWYDEPSSWLAASITSLARCNVDHVVAVDGAYLHYPGALGKPNSGIDQAVTIQEVCKAAGMGCTVHIPTQPWMNGEVEKRSFLFNMAEQLAEPDDWYFVVDADEIVRTPTDLRKALADVEEDVAEIQMAEPDDVTANPQKEAIAHSHFTWQKETHFVTRRLFRAVPGLHVSEKHYRYITGDGRCLWGNREMGDDMIPAFNLCEELVLEHRRNFRDKGRKKEKSNYYKTRDNLGLEMSACAYCSEPAVRAVPVGWRIEDEGVTSGWSEVCDKHAKQARGEGIRKLKELGYADPMSLEVNINGDGKKAFADFFPERHLVKA